MNISQKLPTKYRTDSIELILKALKSKFVPILGNEKKNKTII